MAAKTQTKGAAKKPAGKKTMNAGDKAAVDRDAGKKAKANRGK